MAPTTRLKGRYEPREILGEGGMGIVYRAFDAEVPREVALKTIREAQGFDQLELFRKECEVLAMLHHPNIVDLYDYGDYEEGGQKKPFFVMPLLPGVTLDKLIRNSAARLTVERVIDIMNQTCRGLQAAHEKGLVHRDIKPSNIFVLDDDSVKLIDFGVVHVTDNRSRSGVKGTLSYMSPEQIEMTAPTALSDIFSLAVVCYEALARRRAFTGTTEDEIAQAILTLTPPPVSDLNPAVNLALTQVIHAAMAKKTWHRTSSARQFAEELQKALHGQTIQRFDTTRIEPRIRRAQTALEESEYEFAGDILSELEAEGHFHPELRALRRQIDQALRAKTVTQLLDSAKRRFEKEEYPLALQKVEEILRLDSTNPDASVLKSAIQSKHKTQQIDNWVQLAEEHVKNHAYSHARQALQNVLQVNSTHTRAIHMLADVDRQEQDYLKERREKEDLYKVAIDCWHRGDVSSALTKLERVLELDRRAPDAATSGSAHTYQNLYKEVRSEHDAIKNGYEEARKLLSENNFDGAVGICEKYLAKYPGHALYQSLKFDIGERHRQYVSALVAKIDRDVEAEPDLNRRVAILTEALAQYPDEPHFQRALKVITDRRDLVNSIAQKARNLEERGQFTEALGQLEILSTVYPQYPGLDFERERLARRRSQQTLAETRTRWIDQVDRAHNSGDFGHALKSVESALAEFPDDAELIALQRLIQDSVERVAQASLVLEQGQELCAKGQIEAGLDCLWQAHRLDEPNPLIRAVLVETLLKRASSELDRDSAISEQLIRQAAQLDPGNTAVKSLQRMVVDKQKTVTIDNCLLNSRNMQAAGDLKGALAEVEKGLGSFPEESRLRTRRETLLKQNEETNRSQEKSKDLDEMNALFARSKLASTPADQNSIAERTRAIARKHPKDEQVQSALKEVENGFATAMFKGQPGSKQTGPPQTLQPVKPPSPQAAPEKVIENVVVEAPGEQRKGIPKLAKVAMVLALLIIAAALGVPRLLQQPTPEAPPPSPPTPATTPVAETPAAPFEFPLEIRTSVPGAMVIVNDEEKGVAPVKLSLGEGEYRIDARLAGYRSVAPQVFKVSQGTEMPNAVDVALQPLPPTPVPVIAASNPAVLPARLEIKDGTPEAEVMLDGVRIGTLDRSGNLNWSVQSAGTHALEFRKRDHEFRRFEREFRSNEATLVSGEQSRLKPFGWIEVNVVPRNSEVSYQLRGESERHVVRAGETVRLKAGTYSVTVRADKFTPRTENVEVSSGEGLPIDWRLAPVDAAVESIIIGPEGLQGQLSAGDWREVRSPFALFRENLPGKYFFNIKLAGGVFGRKRAIWLVNVVDARNYLEYVIDEAVITQNAMVNGRRIEGKPLPHKLGRAAKDYYAVMVEVVANKIVVSGAQENAGYTILSQHSDDRNLLQGKFGFPKDQSVNQFRFEGVRRK